MGENDKKLSRRQFLIEAGRWMAAAAGLGLAGVAFTAGVASDSPAFVGYPFSLGVASGDPLPDGVVLWTRLAPDPLHRGGMPNETVPVQWELAADDRFAEPVQRGVAYARPELGHSVHVETSGLAANQVYYYRFRYGDEISPTGRTKTLPPSDALATRCAFAFASCQNYEDGYFTAYRHMSHEDLDFVLHLGDYIYEGGAKFSGVRRHEGGETVTLADYRNRYALYRSDPDLQAAHAAFPWIAVLDDHEVDNNWAGAGSPESGPIDRFVRRRAAAFQAYYEHMPLRMSSMPNGGSMRLYRRFQYGTLATFHVLDTRQYRDAQADRRNWGPPNERMRREARTLLGEEQEAWLLDGLTESGAVWNVAAQQVFFARRDGDLTDGVSVSKDAWDGYPAARERILRCVRERRVRNFMVLTGDVHANWANEILSDFDRPTSKPIGVEWVGTSISSAGDGSDRTSRTDAELAHNPHLKFFNGNRGYVVCRVNADEWRTDYRIVPYVTRRGAPVLTRATFVVASGNLRLRQTYGSERG
ncbi:alkaline phosphatase D family protein [Paenibacillus sp.]|uniref:alkaline phosphatase D family protein n=1 Tax=Paenibacillus sp. TaxID=58172 RepID=UPI002D2ADAD3|nr:alkaline phosphatase D family protein [Paenibacillus sp.]HZG56338.1 alkaline phosphatase D family protein [Paenibacillus sp.]